MMGRRPGQRVGPYWSGKKPLYVEGAALREVRKDARLTLRDLAHKTAISKTALIRLELTAGYCTRQDREALYLVLPDLARRWPTKQTMMLYGTNFTRIEPERSRLEVAGPLTAVEKSTPSSARTIRRLVKGPRPAGSSRHRTFSDRKKSKRSRRRR